MTREETFEHAMARRLKVVQRLRIDVKTPNAELQKIYGDKLMSTQHMGLLKRAVEQGIEHPERYSPKGLKARLDGAEKPRKKHAKEHGKLRVLPSAVDKLAGLKRFLDETVLPSMLAFTVGSDVQTVVITVTTDPAGNPTLSRKIGRAVTEWDEHTLDPAKEVENG
jgi:hypothetical protein